MQFILQSLNQKYKQITYPSSLIRQLELGAKLKQKQHIIPALEPLLQSIYCEVS